MTTRRRLSRGGGPDGVREGAGDGRPEAVAAERDALRAHLAGVVRRGVRRRRGRGSAGVARVEGVGPVTIGQVREFLRHTHVSVRPVIDLDEDHPVDGYEVPDRLREQVHLRTPAGCSRGRATCRGARTWTTPCPTCRRTRGGPPGQTRIAQPRADGAVRAPGEDPRPGLAAPPAGARGVLVAHPARLLVPHRPHRHPPLGNPRRSASPHLDRPARAPAGERTRRPQPPAGADLATLIRGRHPARR